MSKSEQNMASIQKKRVVSMLKEIGWGFYVILLTGSLCIFMLIAIMLLM